MTHRYSTTVSESAARVLHDGHQLLARFGHPQPPRASPPGAAGLPRGQGARAGAVPKTELRDSLTLRGIVRDFGQANDPGWVPAVMRCLAHHGDPEYLATKDGSQERWNLAFELGRRLAAEDPTPSPNPMAALAPLGPKELPAGGVANLPSPAELQKEYPKEPNDLARLIKHLEATDENFAQLPYEGIDGRLHVAGQLLDQLRRDTANAVGARAVAELVRRARERNATRLASAKGQAASAPAPAPIQLADLPGRNEFEKAERFLTRVDPTFASRPLDKRVSTFKQELRRHGVIVPERTRA